MTSTANSPSYSGGPSPVPNPHGLMLEWDTPRKLKQKAESMTAQSVNQPTVAKMRLVRSDLAAAYREAKSYDFDLPSQRAYERATRLLQRLVVSNLPTDSLEIAFGEDGVIELTLHVRGNFVVVDVEPAGTVVQMVVRESATGKVEFPAAEVTEAQLIQHLEHIAAA